MASEKQQIANIQRELAGVVAVAVKGIATGVLDAAVATTPVDSGLTRANWQASAGKPVTRAVGNRTASGVARAQTAQDASRAAIAGWTRGTLSIGNAEGNVTRINEGATANAPAFVQRAIRRGVAVGGAKAIAAARAASRRR